MALHNLEWSVKLVSTKKQIETANETMLTPNLLVGAIVIQIIFSCAWKNLNQLLVNESVSTCMKGHIWKVSHQCLVMLTSLRFVDLLETGDGELVKPWQIRVPCPGWPSTVLVSGLARRASSARAACASHNISISQRWDGSPNPSIQRQYKGDLDAISNGGWFAVVYDLCGTRSSSV